MDLASQRRRHRGGRQSGVGVKDHGSRRELLERHVVEELGDLQERVVVGHLRDADHPHRPALQVENPAERIAAGPVPGRHGFVDDRHGLSGCVVGLREVAAGEDRDPQGREEVGADLVVFRRR